MNAINPLHTRLRKHLKRSNLTEQHLPSTIEEWQHFLQHLHRFYTEADQAKLLLERSLEVSSQEMRQLYDNLKLETEQRIEALHKSEQKTRFMANMSHELRTPIHGILGSLEILKNTQLDERQTLFVNTAYNSCEVILDVVNNILDFSKIKAGKMELEIIEFSPSELMENISSIMSNIAKEKALVISCEISPNIPTRVKGDSSRLRQMLMNLIGNAIKFTEKGEIFTRLSLRELVADEALLHFEVCDTGIGIPASMHKSIFESFVQVDASINRSYGGTGLGLTIVREFVEIMGGRIGVQSTPGQGSTFWFEIRLPVAEVNQLSKSVYPLEGQHILVVDDNETNRRILENYLQTWKAQATIASSGAEALTYLQQSVQQSKPFNLLLLDWFMPQMDGIALAKAIRADTRYQHIPIVMLTSYGLSQEKQQQIGIQAAVTKPIRSVTLRDVLMATLRHTTTSNEQSPSATPLPMLPPSELVVSEPTILLAEDNQVNALIAITMLEALNIRVDHVTTGKQALKAMRSKSYQLVLMDINMPEMDGYTATRYVRKWENEGVLKYHIPIIAMTANALQGDRERCLGMGMDDYISKPVKQDDLLRVVRHWIIAPADDITLAFPEF